MSGAWLVPFFLHSLTVVLIVALAGYKYATYHYDKWKKLGVPYTEPVPPFGNIGETIMGRTPLAQSIHAYYERFDGTRFFGIYEARDPVLVVRDPALVHAVMVKDFGSFHDRLANDVSFKHDKLFDHLVHLRGDKWKSVRSKLSPTFSAAKLRSMLGDINECTARLVDNLDAQITHNNGMMMAHVLNEIVRHVDVIYDIELFTPTYCKTAQ